MTTWNSCGSPENAYFQRSSRGSSAASWRASSSSITGTASRMGEASRSMRHTSTCASRLNNSVPLQTGQARISSSRASILSRPRLRCSAANLRQYARQQFAGLRRAELRADRNVPQSRVAERCAFYGILLGHEYRQLIAEGKLRNAQRMVIRKSVLLDLDAVRAQRGKEARRIANAGHGVHALAAEGAKTARGPKPIEAERLRALKPHGERAGGQPPQRGVLGRTVHHDGIGPP